MFITLWPLSPSPSLAVKTMNKRENIVVTADVGGIDDPPCASPALSSEPYAGLPRRLEFEDLFEELPGRQWRTGTTLQHHHGATNMQHISRKSSISSRASPLSPREKSPLSQPVPPALAAAAAAPHAPSSSSSLSASFAPSKEELYGNRRQRQRETARQHKAVLSDTQGAEEIKMYDAPVNFSAPAAMETTATTAAPQSGYAHYVVEMESRDAPIADAVLQRVQATERAFDHKIHEIHDTFQNAGEQLVARDKIIARLQDELNALRMEAAKVPKDYQAREQQLLRRMQTVMDDLREERERTMEMHQKSVAEMRQLRNAVEVAERRAIQQQQTADSLMEQLRSSDKALYDLKHSYADDLEKNRYAYESKLREVQLEASAAEKKLARVKAMYQDVEKDRSDVHARLLEADLSASQWKSSEATKARALRVENQTLKDDVEASRLSIARLLHLMSEVPAFANYLRWNEMESEFVFLGYPTRYFPLTQTGRGSRSGGPGGNSEGTTSVERRAFNRSRSQYSPRRHEASSGRGGGGETGVDDGVYGGVPPSASKNMWLNGRFAQQLMEIIASENNYTRLKRIKILELEEAGQLSDQLPTARDVLECRRPEYDYWVPYEVFSEAQKFKNKFYPKLPAMSHFYPFLIRLNKIWRAKLQDRIRILKRSDETNFSRSTSRGKRQIERDVSTSGLSELGSRWLSRNQVDESKLKLPIKQDVYAVIANMEREIDGIEAEHHRLRREVRLHVSSQRSLRLFYAYDELVHCTHQRMKKLLDFLDGMHDQIAQQQQEQQRSLPIHGVEQLVAQQDDFGGSRQAHRLSRPKSSPEKYQLRKVLRHTCNEVCAVGDALSSQMMRYYSDLQQLIQILHKQIRELQGLSGSWGGLSAPASPPLGGSSATVWSNSSTVPGQSSSVAGPEMGMASRAKGYGVLHSQYGTDANGVMDGELPASAPQTTSLPLDTLLKLSASVLDFGEELRREVEQARDALHVIADEALEEVQRADDATDSLNE